MPKDKKTIDSGARKENDDCETRSYENRRHYLLSVLIPSSISGSPLRSNDKGDHLSPFVHNDRSSSTSSFPARPRRLSHFSTEASFCTRPSSSCTIPVASASTSNDTFPTPFIVDDGFYLFLLSNDSLSLTSKPFYKTSSASAFSSPAGSTVVGFLTLLPRHLPRAPPLLSVPAVASSNAAESTCKGSKLFFFAVQRQKSSSLNEEKKHLPFVKAPLPRPLLLVKRRSIFLSSSAGRVASAASPPCRCCNLLYQELPFLSSLPNPPAAVDCSTRCHHPLLQQLQPQSQPSPATTVALSFGHHLPSRSQPTSPATSMSPAAVHHALLLLPSHLPICRRYFLLMTASPWLPALAACRCYQRRPCYDRCPCFLFLSRDQRCYSSPTSSSSTARSFGSSRPALDPSLHRCHRHAPPLLSVVGSALWPIALSPPDLDLTCRNLGLLCPFPPLPLLQSLPTLLPHHSQSTFITTALPLSPLPSCLQSVA
ncbi:hypothetical protein B296_00033094 [Ensete ventricosum]|uniref:Uncharacterized protein n=1 Tax=Ensete ventricosum TaxID=4639 RepID=A0A426YHU4_ENSVE|nr:hypothetical protein B296_00033094 [Ensete ventricosum]